ncbi:MAG: hypothetical protein LBI84_10265 [Propionibacteriaceae bacterium]|nr:hypothetical protein [Propionibacteriaceae bacterium]
MALAACSAADDEPPDDSPPPLPTEKQSESAPVPEFTGPWANDFREAYLSTANSLARGILADGAVSDSEMSEATAAYQSCLEGQGFTVEYLNSDGSMSFSPPLNPAGEPLDTAEALRTQQQCAGETAWNHISALHTFTRSNPENEDSLLLIARCLVRVGLRPEGYSADDYGSEAMSGVFEGWLQPDAPENERFSACQKDPLQAT